MARKLDRSLVKRLLFGKGERIVFAICALVAIWFVSLGFLKAASASNANWPRRLKAKTNEVKTVIVRGDPEVVDPVLHVDFDDSGIHSR